MTDIQQRPILEPGPDHSIEIEPSSAPVTVRVSGVVVAHSERALTLREAGYEPVLYIPADDVDFSKLEATGHSTYCPYKGDAAYYSAPAGGERSVNAAWQYREPFAAVEKIRDHLAFYPDRVD